MQGRDRRREDGSGCGRETYAIMPPKMMTAGARSGMLSTVSCLNFLPKLAKRVDICCSSNGDVCCSTCPHPRVNRTPFFSTRTHAPSGRGAHKRRLASCQCVCPSRGSSRFTNAPHIILALVLASDSRSSKWPIFCLLYILTQPVQFLWTFIMCGGPDATSL